MAMRRRARISKRVVGLPSMRTKPSRKVGIPNGHANAVSHYTHGHFGISLLDIVGPRSLIHRHERAPLRLRPTPDEMMSTMWFNRRPEVGEQVARQACIYPKVSFFFFFPHLTCFISLQLYSTVGPLCLRARIPDLSQYILLYY